MNLMPAESKDRISSMWEIANKLIETEGEINAPIVILSYHDEENFALLNGSNFDTKTDFIAAIHRAASTVEANSAMMIASAKAVSKDEQIQKQLDSVGESNEIVLLAYKSKTFNFQQFAPIQLTEGGEKVIGEIKNFGGLINNSFFDGLFDVMH
jgi:hypothetical protein